jgi:hypothetical protein
VWNIFFVFLSTSCFEILPLAFIWEGVMLHYFFFSMLFDLSTVFSMLLEHILFFSMTPLSFCKNTRREISLELWSIYLFVSGWMACFA